MRARRPSTIAGDAGRRGCFQPGYGVLGLGEWHQEGMHIGVASRRLARGGGREVVWIVVEGCCHKGMIAQRLNRRGEKKCGISFGMSDGFSEAGRDGGIQHISARPVPAADQGREEYAGGSA